MAKNIFLWLIVIAVVVFIFSTLDRGSNKADVMNYSAFVTAVTEGDIKKIEIDGEEISGTKANGSDFTTIRPAITDNELMPLLRKHEVEIQGAVPDRQGIGTQLLIGAFPILLIIGLLWLFTRGMGGGAGGGMGGRNPMSFGKSKAKMLSEDDIKVTFADVAGCEESKQEVVEVVDFLKDPKNSPNLEQPFPVVF